MSVDVQNDKLVHAYNVFTNVSWKIATKQALCLRPAVLAQLCSVVAKSQEKIVFCLVTYRQGTIETPHNLRFACEVYLHQFFQAGNQEWKLERSAVDRAVPTI
jgi:hypothetical protein